MRFLNLVITPPPPSLQKTLAYARANSSKKILKKINLIVYSYLSNLEEGRPIFSDLLLGFLGAEQAPYVFISCKLIHHGFFLVFQ